MTVSFIAGTHSQVGGDVNLVALYPGAVQDGDLLFLQFGHISSASQAAAVYSLSAGWTAVAVADQVINARRWLYYRVATANLSSTTYTVGVSGGIPTGTQSIDIIQFRGVNTNTPYEGLTNVSGNSTVIGDAPVVSTGHNELACNFIFCGPNSDIGDFTGEVGGDWTAAYGATGSGAARQTIQVSTLTSSGTIDGGTVTIGTSGAWLNRGLSLIALEPIVISAGGISIASMLGAPPPVISPTLFSGVSQQASQMNRNATGFACLFSAGTPVCSESGAIPEMGVYRWEIYDHPTNISGFSTWLGRDITLAAAFEASDTWSNIAGPAWQMESWGPWVSAQAGRNIILAVPMLTDAGSTLSGIVDGTYDTYWQQLADNLVANNLERSILRIGWEFNGDWFNWSAAGVESTFISAWQRIVNTIRNRQPTAQLKFSWCQNLDYDALNYDAYPGDSYVDYISCDVYDQSWVTNSYPYPDPCDEACHILRQGNAWSYISDGLNSILAFAVTHNKKMGIDEWGIFDRSDGHGGLDNPSFVQNIYDFITTNSENIAYHVYFDVVADDGDHQLSPGDDSHVTQFPNSAALFISLFSSLNISVTGFACSFTAGAPTYVSNINVNASGYNQSITVGQIGNGDPLGLWVAKTGKNTNPGNFLLPFLTIDYAAGVVNPGNTVYVMPGTYSERVFIDRGGTSNNARVSFVSYVKHEAHITWDGTNETIAGRADYVNIEDFDITNTNDTLPDAAGINNYGSYVKIIGNYIHDCTGGSGTTHWTVGYTLHDIDHIGNIVLRCGSDSFTHGIYASFANGVVKNNITGANGGYGIHLWHAATNIVITNNLTFANGQSGIVVGQGDSGSTSNGADNCVVNNNIAINNNLNGIVEEGIVGNNNVYYNNIVYGNGLAGIDLINGTEGGTITDDAQFVNYQSNGSGDYHLQSDSPARNAGVSQGAPSTDIDGTSRPQEDYYDIGPYEYVP